MFSSKRPLGSWEERDGVIIKPRPECPPPLPPSREKTETSLNYAFSMGAKIPAPSFHQGGKNWFLGVCGGTKRTLDLSTYKTQIYT